MRPFGILDVRVRSSVYRSSENVGSFAAARQASVLFLAAGVMTLVNNHISAAHYHAINDVVGVLAVLASPVGMFLPWGRWPARSTLVYFPFCLTLLVMSSVYGSNPREIYAFWYVVAFVWVGMHHPPNLARAQPPAAIAYLVPLLSAVQPSGKPSSPVIAIPGAVLIGDPLGDDHRVTPSPPANKKRSISWRSPP
jgi:hypothetical protein